MPWSQSRIWKPHLRSLLPRTPWPFFARSSQDTFQVNGSTSVSLIQPPRWHGSLYQATLESPATRPLTWWLRAAPTSLNLFPSDLKLMGTKSWTDQLTTSIQSWEEGRRLILLGISLGSSLFSTGAGRAKAIHNQLFTGNISYSTLLMLLWGHVDGERISAAAHPQRTLFAKAKLAGLFKMSISTTSFVSLHWIRLALDWHKSPMLLWKTWAMRCHGVRGLRCIIFKKCLDLELEMLTCWTFCTESETKCYHMQSFQLMQFFLCPAMP